MTYWEKKPIDTNKVQELQQANDSSQYAFPNRNPVVLDEQALSEIQEDPEYNVFEDEEQDISEIMGDCNLRLEQGRLYQMVLQNDIFGDTNADPKAIRNVQREIRKFVRERMETMLGIRQEQTVKEAVVSSPFNDMEVTVLKMLASRMSKGESEKATSPAPAALIPPSTPKKDGITAISGNLRPKESSTPLRKEAKPLQSKAQPLKKSAIQKEEVPTLQKPIDQMSPEELVAHNKAAEERSAKKYATLPNNMTPHPTPQGLEMLYTQSASNMSIANPWRTNQS